MISLPYRLVALDADGTLFSENLTVRPAVREAIRQAQERGVIVTVATGRAFSGAQVAARQIDADLPLICFQGSIIQHAQTEEVIYQATFPRDLVPELMAWARSAGVHMTVYVDNTIYLEEQRYEDEFYDLWFGLPRRLVPDVTVVLPNDPMKFLIVGEPDELDAIRPDLAARFAGRLDIIRSHSLFLEGVPPGVSKGNALARLAVLFDVPRTRVVAVGDAQNDVSMIEWAGLGVAMGQASQVVKQAADWVAPTVEEDGVAEVFRRFVLEGGHNGHETTSGH